MTSAAESPVTTPPPRPERAGRGFHLVQVSYDESILQAGSKSDTLARQSQYAAELRRLSPGARITVIVLTFDPAARPFEHGGVAYLPVPYRRRFQIPWRLFRALDRMHARDPVDIVTTQSVQEDGLGSLLFRKLRGVPSVGQIHIDIFHPAARRENFGSAPWRWVMGPVTFWTLDKYDALRVVGSRIRKRLEERKVPGRIHLVPVAMPLMAGRYEGDPVPEHKVVFVGRLEQQKRLDLWLEVAAAVSRRDPSVRFELAGEGSQRAELERRSRELGLEGKVRFLGLVPYGELPALYASSKVFLITSSYEGFGRVVAEAMHFKVPVVAYRITGIEDIVADGETGCLHAFGDIEGMAGSVLRLTGNEDLRRSLGAAARDSVDAAFHPDRLAREWMALLVGTDRIA